MILEYLEKMREKPLAVRKRFAFICAFSFTAVVALIWGVSLPSQLAALSLSSVTLPETVDTDALEDSFSEQNARLGEMVGTQEDRERALSIFNELQESTASSSPVEEGETAQSENVILETTKTPVVQIATTSTVRRD